MGNATMQLVRGLKQCDVIVTGNLFGDVLSPAPNFAGKDIASPGCQTVGSAVLQAPG